MSPQEQQADRALHEAAWKVARPRVHEVGGPEFLAGLIQDPAGELLVVVRLKRGTTQLLCEWPAFSTSQEVISETAPNATRMVS